MRDVRIFRMLCTLFLVVGLLAAPTAQASSDEGPVTYEGNQRCEAIGLVQAYNANVTRAPTSGVDPSGRFGWAAYDGETGHLVDWSSTVPVAAVLVKGRTSGNQYAYGGALGDVALHAPQGQGGEWADVSRITFCMEPEPGLLTIEKATEPAGADAVFGFTSTIDGFAPMLADGGAATAEVAEGRYTVTEMPVAGWELADVTCDLSGAVVDLAARSVELDVMPGANVTCVFENVEIPDEPGTLQIPEEPITAEIPEEPGTAEIVEETIPQDEQTTLALPGEEERGTPAVPVLVTAETGTVSWDFSTGLRVDPGTEIEIAQLTVPDPAGSQCSAEVEATNGKSVHLGHNLNVYVNDALLVTLQGIENEPFQFSAGSAGFVSSGSDQLVVALESTLNRVASLAGSLTVTCAHKGKIVIEKITDPPGAAQTFDFTSTVAGFAPSLGDGETASVDVESGSYTVTETVAAGWELQDISCDDPEADIHLADGAATVYVADGATVKCTFTNHEIPEPPGKIVIEKVTDPSEATATFTFATSVPGWAPELGNGESSEVVVEAGEYTITEAMTPEWTLTDLTCDDPTADIDLQGIAVVTVDPGETVTCTFTNTQQGTLWVGKTTEPATDDVYFAFTSDIAGWPPDLHSGMSASTTVDPGTYTVTELAAEGWDLSDLVCDDPDAIIDLTTSSATVHVGAGEFVKCEFTNKEVELLGAIGDFVWHDKDRDGVQESGEPGIEGVRVNVYATGGSAEAQEGSVDILATPPILLVATTRTDEDGRYLIDNLPAGNYMVEFTNLPKGYHFTKQFAAGDKYIDSDAALTSGFTPVMVLPAGFVDLTCDAGAYIVAQEVLPLTGSDLDGSLGAGLMLILMGAACVLAVKPRKVMG